MTKARKRKRVHRVARGKPKPGHIVAHNRRRRKGEILCHNHVLPYYGDRQRGAWLPLVHSVCASRMGPGQARRGKSARVDGVPNYGSTAKANHVQWWRDQIKERGSLEAAYREIRRRQREYRDTDVG